MVSTTSHTNGGLDIVFFCNPLLDISVDDHDGSLSEKYKLQHGQACLAGEEHMPLFEEIFHREGRLLIPGGSGLNSARACGYCFNKQSPGKGVVGYVGCIGKDERGKALSEAVAADGVKAFFQEEQDHKTGACAVVVKEKERALCAYLGASAKYAISHLNDNSEKIYQANYIYATGFFITSNAEALRQVAKHCADNDKPFGFNISAAFVVDFYFDDVKFALEHADFVFCNEDEADAYGKKHDIAPGNREETAKVIASLPKANGRRARHVIITQGKEPVIVASKHPDSEVTVTSVELTPIDRSLIVDTNGCGDSFVGAFFAANIQGHDVIDCVKAGNALAGIVITKNGCTFE